MNETGWSHFQIIAGIVLPLGSGMAWLMVRQARQIAREAQNQLKLDLMWEWFTNHGHDLTGYKPGDEHRGRP